MSVIAPFSVERCYLVVALGNLRGFPCIADFANLTDGSGQTLEEYINNQYISLNTFDIQTWSSYGITTSNAPNWKDNTINDHITLIVVGSGRATIGDIDVWVRKIPQIDDDFTQENAPATRIINNIFGQNNASFFYRIPLNYQWRITFYNNQGYSIQDTINTALIMSRVNS